MKIRNFTIDKRALGRMSREMSEEEPRLNQPQIAKKLGVCNRTVELWKCSGKLPHRRDGGSVYYLWSEVKPLIKRTRYSL